MGSPRCDRTFVTRVGVATIVACAFVSASASAQQPGASTTCSHVRVESRPPGASVAVDGATIGVAPLPAACIEPGWHTFVFTRAGFIPYEQRTLVAAGQDTVRATLAHGGSLRVTSRSSGARVRLDGQDVGATPLVIDGLRVGAHQIEVQEPGEPTRSRTVRVRAGGTTIVRPPTARRGG